MLNRILPVIALLAAIAFAMQASAQAPGFVPPAATSSPNAPKYDDKNLLFPDGFRSWMFVGSNRGLLYKGDAEAGPDYLPQYLHQPRGLRPFPRHRTIPGSDHVRDGYIRLRRTENPKTSSPAAATTGRGTATSWRSRIRRVRRARTARSRFGPIISSPPTRPIRPSRRRQQPAEPDTRCEACHKEHGMNDNVWVQFYPILRSLVKATTK